MKASVVSISNAQLLEENCVFVDTDNYNKLRDLASLNDDPRNLLYLDLRGVPVLCKADATLAPGSISLPMKQRERCRLELRAQVDLNPCKLSGKVDSVLLEIRSARELRADTELEGDTLYKIARERFTSLPAVSSNNGEYYIVIDRKTFILTIAELNTLPDPMQASQVSGPGAATPCFHSTTNYAFRSVNPKLVLKGGHIDHPTSATAATIAKFIGPTDPSNETGQQSVAGDSPDKSFSSILEIGGLDKQLRDIFRRAFSSHMISPAKLQELGISHVKGLLLYGPPGTGKTLIARSIGKILNTREPKVVSGPEVLNKFVGGSEENVRNLFADAEKEWEEKKERSELHLIIMDELDAICRQRGSRSDSTGTMDSVVNQLLAKMDGPTSLGNILVIGMTNRKELIDDALLRPGRFEVHLEIGLPDLEGRHQILQIHTKRLSACNSLDSSVDLEEIAKKTPNFSGAELAGLVRSATSFAINRVVGLTSNASSGQGTGDIVVTRDDFLNALTEVKPSYGSVDEADIDAILPLGIVPGEPYDSLVANVLDFVKTIDQGSSLIGSLLLCSETTGVGATAICARVIRDAGFDFAKVVSMERLVRQAATELGIANSISNVFEAAYHVPKALIILDGIEGLINYTPVGMRFSTTVFRTIASLVHCPPPSGRKLVVIGTTAAYGAMHEIGLAGSFEMHVRIPRLELDQACAYIRKFCETITTRSGVQCQLEPNKHVSQALKAMASDGRPIRLKPIILALEEANRVCKEEDRPLKWGDVERSLEKI
ncbi:Vesicle-fusing ATPase [Giardia muris]|uniref:Vesicle-fusing ATPase n=1 Tax=Giardia muris TaxID=5742 RepID=A0A4Z1SLW6_GIAMU|nr:Vesicle-fusing ATPase [Giardia muris]|eukprot:TNJ26654.1 Vesicle-fusing ATPase [Giardia muris]